MAQLTLYLDDEIAEKMKQAAGAVGVSQSRWVAELIRERVTEEWPQAVRELAGAWLELPLAEELRSWPVEDATRESL